MNTLWTWNVKCEQVKCEGAQTIFSVYLITEAEIQDLLKISNTSWVINSRQQQQLMRHEGKMLKIAMTERKQIYIECHVMPTQPQVRRYIHERVATLPSLGRHESYNFSYSLRISTVSRNSFCILHRRACLQIGRAGAASSSGAV